MTSRATATAAPASLKIEGKTYLFSPLADEDFGEYELWLADWTIALAKRNVEGLAPHLADSMLNHAYDKAAEIQIKDIDFGRSMSTFAGGTMITWMSVRRRHPDMTLEAWRKILMSKSIFAACVEKFPLGLPDEEDLDGKKKRPTKKVDRKKKKQARQQRKGAKG